MGLEYYRSIKEKEELQKKITEHGYRIFNDYKIDENGNVTDVNGGMLTFGSQTLADEGINNEYHRISGRFQLEIDKIRLIVEYFPSLYESHKKNLTELLQENLHIHNDNELQKRIQNLEDKSPYSIVSNDKFGTLCNILALETFYETTRGKNKIDLHYKLTEFNLHLPNDSKFLREMSLVYLIAIFNGFLKNIITILFQLKENLLDNFDINKEQNIEETIDEITTKMTLGIDEIKESLKKLNLNLSEDRDWNKFREVFLRRNSFVHNDRIPSKKYKKSFPQYSNVEKLDVSTEYLNESLKLFKKFHRLIWDFFWENQVHPLWLQQLKDNDKIISK